MDIYIHKVLNAAVGPVAVLPLQFWVLALKPRIGAGAAARARRPGLRKSNARMLPSDIKLMECVSRCDVAILSMQARHSCMHRPGTMWRDHGIRTEIIAIVVDACIAAFWAAVRKSTHWMKHQVNEVMHVHIWSSARKVSVLHRSWLNAPCSPASFGATPLVVTSAYIDSPLMPLPDLCHDASGHSSLGSFDQEMPIDAQGLATIPP